MESLKLCECGCGNPVQVRPYQKHRKKPVRYLPGHHVRLAASQGRAHRQKYIPTAEEAPSGFCECGCGQPTKIAAFTAVARRWFKGYPVPYVRGHGMKRTGPRKSRDNGRWIAHGYALLHKPDHPFCSTNGTIQEHRYVMEQHLGRYLTKEERVHHRNGFKSDNRLSNLELWTVKDPPGQRVTDLLAFAREILARYEPEEKLLLA